MIILLICINIILLIVTASPLIVIMVRILTDECNHVTDEIQYLNVLFIFNIVVAFIQLKFGLKNKTIKILVYTLLILNILAILFMITIDQFNILLEYSRWTRRGMPGRPWEE